MGLKRGLSALACLALFVALGACATLPDTETNVRTQVEAERLVADVERMAANKARVDATWAKFWAAENESRIQAAFKDDVAALIAGAAAAARQVADAEIVELVDRYAEIRKAAAERIDAVRAAADDPNFATARERALLLLDYVSELTERERAAARVRRSLGLAERTGAAAPGKAVP